MDTTSILSGCLQHPRRDGVIIAHGIAVGVPCPSILEHPEHSWSCRRNFVRSNRFLVETPKPLLDILLQIAHNTWNGELMADVQVLLYKEDDGTVPILNWLDGVPGKVQDRCAARIKRLRDVGHELRRPEADYLRTAYMN